MTQLRIGDYRHEYNPQYEEAPAASHESYDQHVYCDLTTRHHATATAKKGVFSCSHKDCILNKWKFEHAQIG